MKAAARGKKGKIAAPKPARRAQALRVAKALAAAYPRSRCALVHDNPFQLLVATVLSAQATDLSVNAATRHLFAACQTPAALAQASREDVERAIGGIGLWRAKAKNVQAIARQLVERHAGEVPRSLEELVALPGVGRKTATAVLGTAFAIAAGVTVDTHMLRINRLLGLTRNTEPEKVAADLEALLPPEAWAGYTHRVIDHGRLVCVARRPRCGVCPLAGDCASAFDPQAGYKPEYDGKEPASAKGLSWKAWEGVKA